MAKITINGVEVDAEPGRRLVEVIKEQGVAITNLCYIDGLDPYAGCRTCLVHIEGGRRASLREEQSSESSSNESPLNNRRVDNDNEKESSEQTRIDRATSRRQALRPAQGRWNLWQDG